MNEGKRTLNSIFGFWTVGIVSKDKERESSLIMFFPTEHLNDTNGQLDTVSTEVVSVELNGVVNKFAVDKSSSLIAKWCSINQSNRYTPPDVRTGETVIIYKAGDAKDWYWDKLFLDDDKRGLEHTVFAWKNTDSRTEHVKLDNSYNMTVSTKDKYVKLHISNNDGEQSGYEFLFDSGNGIFSLKDTKENSIVLNSVAGTLNLDIVNTITAKTIDMVTDTETLTMKASTSFLAKSPDITLDGPVKITSTLDVASNISGADLKTPVVSSSNKHRHGNVSNGDGTSGTPTE